MIPPCAKASAVGAADLALIPVFAVDLYSRSSHTSNWNIGTPVAALQGAWRYRSALGLVSPVPVHCDWMR